MGVSWIATESHLIAFKKATSSLRAFRGSVGGRMLSDSLYFRWTACHYSAATNKGVLARSRRTQCGTVLHFQGSTNWAINAQYLTKIQEVRCLSACPQIVSSAESSHLEEPVYVLSEETDETGDIPCNVYPSSREEHTY
jgi:hypothetical protein